MVLLLMKFPPSKLSRLVHRSGHLFSGTQAEGWHTLKLSGIVGILCHLSRHTGAICVNIVITFD